MAGYFSFIFFNCVHSKLTKYTKFRTFLSLKFITKKTGLSLQSIAAACTATSRVD